jgi:predicted nuclease of predicted toxin-antitoxin system
VRYLVDANLPRALTGWLAANGDEAFYVDDLLAPSAADALIWDLAVAQSYVIVSKDADFAVRATRDQRVQVVWLRCGNLKLAPFEAWFQARHEAMLRLLQMNEGVVELR